MIGTHDGDLMQKPIVPARRLAAKQIRQQNPSRVAAERPGLSVEAVL